MPLNVNFQFLSSASIDTINNLLWDFGNGNYHNTSDENAPVSTIYTNPGSYTVKVFINNNTDSIILNNYITVYPLPESDFDYFILPDLPLSIYFKSNFNNDNPNIKYKYFFGDGDSASFKNVIHTFPDPGLYNVTLYVINEYNCESHTTKSINVPSPGNMPYITATPLIGCDSSYVKFMLHNVDYDTINYIEWDFGNSLKSNEINPPQILYKNLIEPKRTFSVSLNINNNLSILMNNFITIYRTTIAHFVCPDSIVENNRIIKTCYPLDESLDNTINYIYTWEVDGQFYSSDKKIVLTFNQIPDTAIIKLTITNENYGCTDSRTYRQFILPELLIQNVFTPNGDGINDYFIIDSYGIVQLQLKIYSRTGILVYQAEGTKLIWDGLSENGEKLPSGIYFYVIKSLNSNNSRYNKTGFVYLYR